MNPVHIAAALKAMGTTAASLATDMLIIKRKGRIVGFNRHNLKLLSSASAIYAARKLTKQPEVAELKNILAIRPDDTLPMPYHNYEDDAGYDLIAAQNVNVEPLNTAVIESNIKMAIPKGFYGDIRPRSGISKASILVHPGTIDANYRGVVKFTVTNLSQTTFRVRRGDRIAQIIIQKHEKAQFSEVEKLPPSDRDKLGFGSSGGFQS